MRENSGRDGGIEEPYWGASKRGEDNLFNGLEPESSDSEDVWDLACALCVEPLSS